MRVRRCQSNWSVPASLSPTFLGSGTKRPFAWHRPSRARLTKATTGERRLADRISLTMPRDHRLRRAAAPAREPHQAVEAVRDRRRAARCLQWSAAGRSSRAAVDAGLIDFDDAGQIRFAERFSPADRLATGLDDTMMLAKLTPEHRVFPRLAPRPSADRRGILLSLWLDPTMEDRSWLRRRFVSVSRPAKRKFEPSVGTLSAM
jgi:hypothetical protein